MTFHADGPDSWVRVADDGIGMTADALDEAMRYGSDAAYDERALGHFGLGLKTASLSQCRRLTVASRIRICAAGSRSADGTSTRSLQPRLVGPERIRRHATRPAHLLEALARNDGAPWCCGRGSTASSPRGPRPG